jgi:hypothetical protein
MSKGPELLRNVRRLGEIFGPKADGTYVVEFRTAKA